MKHPDIHHSQDQQSKAGTAYKLPDAGQPEGVVDGFRAGHGFFLLSIRILFS